MGRKNAHQKQGRYVPNLGNAGVRPVLHVTRISPRSINLIVLPVELSLKLVEKRHFTYPKPTAIFPKTTTR
ncbi:hypothetical protein EMIT0P260_120026 [Pseudomonas sp. IT-P260]